LPFESIMWQFRSSCFLFAFLAYSVGAVQEVYSHEEFTNLLANAGNLPVIVDFYSPSCGPCHMIAPVFRRVAVEYTGRAVFAKIDCNVNTVTPPMMGVRSMPTFQFFRKNQKVHEFVGADESQLRRTIQSMVAAAEQEAAQQPRPQQPQPQQPPPQQPPPQQRPPQQPTQQPQTSSRRTSTSNVDSLDSELSAQSLLEFFLKVDPSLATKEIVDIYLQENAANMKRFLGFLDRQYGQTPKTRTSQQSQPQRPPQQPEQPRQAQPQPQAPQEQPKVQQSNEDKPKSNEAQDVRSISTEMLKRELAKREEEEAESEVEQDEWRRTHNPCSINRNRDRSLVEKVVIIGGGPSGTTAAIYAARANLCPLAIAPALGGQLMAKGVDVENYPGMPRENGGRMIQVFKQQAESFFTEFMDDTVLSVNVSQRPFLIETKSSGLIKAHSIIISTGADSRWLDVEGEYEYRGHGVSACAACDGYLYKGKSCAVVGGGDTAMEAALMLSRICSAVTIIHRRESFRASWAMQQRVLDNSRITVQWNTDVTRFVGRKKNMHGQWQKFLTHVDLSDPRDRLATKDKLAVDAVFVAIGHDPNTGFLQTNLRLMTRDTCHCLKVQPKLRFQAFSPLAMSQTTHTARLLHQQELGQWQHWMWKNSCHLLTLRRINA